MTGERVLCCYTRLHPGTARSLDLYAPGAELAYVGEDDFAYWREVSRRWDGTADLVLVEHDIEIHSDVLPQFRGCCAQWCTFSYEIMQPGIRIYEGLGCVRFTAALQREVPAQAIEAYYGSCFSCGPGGRSGRMKPGRPGCWRHLDGEILHVLKEACFSACVHEPPVKHWIGHASGQIARA